ncbi:iron-containing alcohol dehydrogenase [Clostridium estertheticum]|uniref:Iron-containing alcohol dehydrogenase n=1 Tax=Clostridium estertheticum TaxID=238834 RepID=A0AA47ELU7_9CLOT|nr:iron-containing alcohol dehydrogenase [Clostridium estertheticum]MBU3156896.1 iron-containing alcohol dehydrogenase [Clostridium estertheticum]MBU3201623.1 iron-containing alcohol dehydrogenase [Clostridium estertheticum]WAG62623.1 iron-containing alcohol dehydrogenase [Clostridium estertheticum]WAG67877.1 iron-containing alcohol dehydrogenase [Clostridium estertheticum]
MRMYDYLAPAVNFMGAGAVKVVGERAEILGGKKALIVTDKFLKSLPGGAVEQVEASLKDKGISFVYYDNVEPNPKDRNAIEGAKIFKDEKCDMIITVGGGSSHDCGKGIGILATHPGELFDYAGIETLASPLPPIIAVNTTAGTGSEVTRHCVITNTKTNIKFVIVSWRNLPSVSINDPLTMVGMPAGLTAATGMDALTHAIEAYVSKDANPVTDASAIQAIKLISNNLRQAYALGENLVARENMCYASLLAGMAFNNANLGYVHAMAHQLGGLYDMPHGVANAILLPFVEKWNVISNPQKFADIAEFMGENIQGLSVLDAAQKSIDAMFRLAKDVGIPANLRSQGAKEEDIEYMADWALKDGNAFSNPRKGNKRDIAELFKSAF